MLLQVQMALDASYIRDIIDVMKRFGVEPDQKYYRRPWRHNRCEEHAWHGQFFHHQPAGDGSGPGK
jgi:hypothetical protein